MPPSDDARAKEDAEDLATATRALEAYRRGERGRDLGELLDEIKAERLAAPDPRAGDGDTRE